MNGPGYSSRLADAMPVVDFAISNNHLVNSEAEVTVVIGNNGSGKTRLLSSIAKAFLEIDIALTSTKYKLNRHFSLSYLHYQIDNEDFEIRNETQTNPICLRNGIVCELYDFILPNRVVGLTVATFDRFPLQRTPKFGDDKLNCYRYLGLRDRTGRSSVLSFVYTALENLLEARRDAGERRDRIAAVFKLLRYNPLFHITYSLRFSRSAIQAAIQSPEFIETLPLFQKRRLQLLFEQSHGYGTFQLALKDALDRFGNERTLKVPVSITHASDRLVEQLQMLRRTGVLSIRAVEIERSDGVIVDLKEASSGELSVASAFMALAGVLDTGSLILIDEPEISLHPEWQSRYVDTLLSAFQSYSGCHYLIATHSPLVVSDLSEGASVYSLDRRKDIDGSDVAGGSVDRLLAQFFGTSNTNNLYVKEELVKALRLAADGELSSPSYIDTVKNLAVMTKGTSADDPVREVVVALQQAAQLEQQ